MNNIKILLLLLFHRYRNVGVLFECVYLSSFIIDTFFSFRSYFIVCVPYMTIYHNPKQFKICESCTLATITMQRKSKISHIVATFTLTLYTSKSMMLQTILIKQPKQKKIAFNLNEICNDEREVKQKIVQVTKGKYVQRCKVNVYCIDLGLRSLITTTVKLLELSEEYFELIVLHLYIIYSTFIIMAFFQINNSHNVRRLR